MFPQPEFLSGTHTVQSELGERTTTTRFGLKRRPVDHLDGHNMTHFQSICKEISGIIL